ncbi:MAG TPA: hypothetical protein PKW14_01565 [Bacteroidota bacterium]|nr:hypothetical protein [Bacteroidota bacterium]
MIKKIVSILFIILFFTSCNDDFDIVKDYHEQLVVFLVLDNRADKQIIKIQKLQNDVGLNDNNKVLKDLSVRLIDTYGVAHYFKDTVLNGVNNFNVLFVDSLDLKEGTYSLFVNSGNKLYAWSNVTVRAPQLIYVSSFNEYYKINISKSASSRGVLVKSFVCFDRVDNGITTSDMMEIPSKFSVNGTDTTEIYPAVEKSDYSENKSIEVIIGYNAIVYTKQKIINRYHIESKDIKKIKIFSFSYDWNLYEYIMSYKGYSDPYSVRLDRPNYSNIIFGNGVFGAIRVDSTEIKP